MNWMRLCFFCQRWRLNWNPLILPHILRSPLTHQASPLQRHRFHHKKVEITRVHHLSDMTAHVCVCVLLPTILVLRRSAQQHGAAVGHDEEGDLPGDDGEEPNKGDQAQGDATSLLKNMSFNTCQSLTGSICRIKRFQTWRRNCSLSMNQVNFHRLALILIVFLRLNCLIWAVHTQTGPTSWTTQALWNRDVIDCRTKCGRWRSDRIEPLIYFRFGVCAEDDWWWCLTSAFQNFLKEYGLIWVGDSGGSYSTGGKRAHLHSVFSVETVLLCAETCWRLPCRCFSCQLGLELWSGAAEDQGTERPCWRRRAFCAIDSYRGPAGYKATCEAEPLQRRDGGVWRPFPALPGAQHAGERDAQNRCSTPLLLLLQTFVLLIYSSSYKTWWMVIFPLNSKADFQTASLLRFYDFMRKTNAAKCDTILQLHSFLSRFTTEETRSSSPDVLSLVRQAGDFCKRPNDPWNQLFVFSVSFHLGSAKRASSDQFLNRAPQVFIQDGHVIDIRNSLWNTLQVPNS